MVKKEEQEPKVVSDKVPVCPECSRRFLQRDFAWIVYNPRLVCNTDAMYLTDGSGNLDEDKDTYESAIDLKYNWKVGICNFCLSDKYNLDFISTRDINDALDDSKEPIADGGVTVNEFEEIHRSDDVSVERTYCDRCDDACKDKEYQLYVNVGYTIDKRKTDFGSRCHVNKNWHSEWDPNWDDVVDLTYDGKVDLCEDCFGEFRPRLLTRARIYLDSVLE